MKAMTFPEYLVEVAAYQTSHPSWRRGQRHFNVLCMHRTDISETIRGTLLDPFYQDARIPTFLEAVRSRWSKS